MGCGRQGHTFLGNAITKTDELAGRSAYVTPIAPTHTCNTPQYGSNSSENGARIERLRDRRIVWCEGCAVRMNLLQSWLVEIKFENKLAQNKDRRTASEAKARLFGMGRGVEIRRRLRRTGRRHDRFHDRGRPRTRCSLLRKSPNSSTLELQWKCLHVKLIPQPRSTGCIFEALAPIASSLQGSMSPASSLAVSGVIN
jgi:hypothetical protein